MYQEIFLECLKTTSEFKFLKVISDLGFTKIVAFFIQHSTVLRSA